MARPLILPIAFCEHDFLSLMKKESHGRNRVRLLAMHHLQLGKSLKSVAELVKSHWITVQAWLQRFKKLGFDGLFESQRSGAPRKLNVAQDAFLSDIIKNLSENKTNGYITGKELHQMLIDKYKVKCSLKTVYNSLHRLGFSWITSRSIHPKSNIEAQNAYKKTLATS